MAFIPTYFSTGLGSEMKQNQAWQSCKFHGRQKHSAVISCKKNLQEHRPSQLLMWSLIFSSTQEVATRKLEGNRASAANGNIARRRKCLLLNHGRFLLEREWQSARSCNKRTNGWPVQMDRLANVSANSDMITAHDRREGFDTNRFRCVRRWYDHSSFPSVHLCSPMNVQMARGFVQYGYFHNCISLLVRHFHSYFETSIASPIAAGLLSSD